MSIDVRRAHVTLSGEPVLSAQYSNSMGGQVTWSATMPGHRPMGSTIPEFILQANEWTSPPLLGITSETSTNPPSTTYSGCDAYSYRMSGDMLSAPTQANKSTLEILQTIGDLASVSIDTSAMPMYDIPEFEIQAGTPLIDHMTRLLRDFGRTYVVTPSGIRILAPAPYTSVPAIAEARNITERLQRGNTVRSVIVRCKRKQAARYEFAVDQAGTSSGSLQPGVSAGSLNVTVENSIGHIAYVLAFDAIGLLCGAYVFDTQNTPPLPPIMAGGDIVELQWAMVPPAGGATNNLMARVIVTGADYGPYSAPFEGTFAPWVAGNKDSSLIIESTLYPNEASVPYQDILDLATQDARTFEAEVPFNPTIAPNGAISAVAWSIGGGTPSTTLTGWIRIW